MKLIDIWSQPLKQTKLAVKLKMINQDRMILGDFSVSSKPITFKFSIQILTALKIS